MTGYTYTTTAGNVYMVVWGHKHTGDVRTIDITPASKELTYGLSFPETNKEEE